jgi:hypothetical protein
MNSLRVRLAAGLVLMFASLAAVLVPVAGPASAGPAPLCITEADTYKTNQTIHAYSFKSCDDGAPVGQSISLEIQVCDQFGCGWATWKSGVGNVSYTCPGTFYAPFRSSRLRSKIVYCTYF